MVKTKVVHQLESLDKVGCLHLKLIVKPKGILTKANLAIKHGNIYRSVQYNDATVKMK